MKQVVQRIANSLDHLGIFRGFEMLEDDPNRLRILTYHRVAEAAEFPQLEPGLISATPREFRLQMALLAERYNVVTLEQVIHAHSGASKLPPRSVLVTFDDGYLDFEKHAWPIMAEFSIPAVLFVPTEFPDGHEQGFWWDRLHHAITGAAGKQFNKPNGMSVSISPDAPRQAYKIARAIVKDMRHEAAMSWVEQTIDALNTPATSSQVIDWSGLRALVSQGVTVCSHGKRHALMTQLDNDTLANDLTESLHRIRDELPNQDVAPVLAYPSGYVNKTVIDAAHTAGYQFGFGGRRGLQTLPCKNTEECFTMARLPVQGYQHGLFRAFLQPGIITLGNQFFRVRERFAA